MSQSLLLILVILCSGAGWRAEEETRLLDGLRERRLFDLAEQHCQRLLARPGLTPTDSATFTIELIKTQTSKAILTNGSERESAWQVVEQTATKMLAEHRDHPRLVLIQVQIALAHLARGQLLRQEIAAELAIPQDRNIALQELQLAYSQLSEIDRVIQARISQQRNRTPKDHELTVDELQKLNNQVRMQLAITNLNRAQLFEVDDRLNRIDVLANVLERLREVQRESVPQQPLWWEANVLQIECFRLMKKLSEALALSETVNLVSAEEPNLMEDRWLEQQLLLALDTADEKASMKYLQAAEKRTDRSPQLDLARLSTAIDFSLRGVSPGRVEWLNHAAQLARNIESQHGAYWGRRAKLILISGGGAVAGDANKLPESGEEASPAELDLIVGLAEQAERQNRLDDALKAYDRASRIATQLNAQPQAFSLAVRAAQVLEKQNRNEDAANRLIKLANENRENPLASAAHLRGCWNWGRLVASEAKADPALGNAMNPAGPTSTNVRARYVDLLNEHLQFWPAADTANQVLIWLGGQLQSGASSSEQWKKVFETFVAVRPESNLFATAMPQANYASRQWIGTVELAQQASLAREVYQRMRSLAESSPAGTPSRHQAVLVASEIAIRFAAVDVKEVRELLSAVYSDPSVSAPFKRQAAVWLYSINSYDSPDPVVQLELLKLIAGDKTSLALADVGMVSVAKQKRGSSASHAVWRVQLSDSALTNYGDQMEPSERTAWLYRKADSLSELGKTRDAITILENLERQLPNDAGIKLRIARLLTIEETNPAKPLAKWRQLAAQLKPQSDGWFEAKYNVGVLLEKTGEADEARKMLQYMQAIPPGWENSHLKDEFNKLLQRLR